MKHLFIVAALLSCLGLKAEAYTLTYEKAASSATVVGVHCSSGAVATHFVPSLAGGNVKTLRIHNHSATTAVYIGFNASVSTGTAILSDMSNLGEELALGANRDFPVAYDAVRKAVTPIYCKSADASANAVISITTFRYQ
jgi:hypothetical protein